MQRAHGLTTAGLAILWLGCSVGRTATDPEAAVAVTVLRGEAVDILLGVIFSAAGLAALALSALRPRSGELYLPSIGIASLFFGVREIAATATFALVSGGSPLLVGYVNAYITYVIPIPFLIFAEQFFGRGLYSSIRRLWQLHVLYAAAAVVIDGFAGPGTAMAPNGPMVIVEMLTLLGHAFSRGSRIHDEIWPLRIGFVFVLSTVLYENLRGFSSWRLDLERFGLLVFLALLVWAAARRLFDRERELAGLEAELETARSIQRSILPTRAPEVRGLSVGVGYLPAAAVAGDLYDFAETGGDRLGVLVVDVCGHGVPAALIASMVKVAFSSQAGHAGAPARLLHEINQILCGELRREFVTAAYVFVDAAEGRLLTASGGHPPTLLQRRSGGRITEMPAGGPILGRFPDARFRGSATDLEPGDRLVLFTDGILEATDGGGELFGESRLHRFLGDHAELPAQRLADELLAHLKVWSGRRSGTAFDDDLTLVVVDFEGQAVLHQPSAQSLRGPRRASWRGPLAWRQDLTEAEPVVGSRSVRASPPGW